MATLYKNIKLINNGTANTTSDSISLSAYDEKSVFVNVTTTSGTATITIEASPDSSTFYTLDTKTYNSSDSDVFSYEGFFPVMRVKSTAMSSATADVFLSARGKN